MDEKMRERMHQIARSLKELHLAANMEEALVRAKEIVESANEKPVNELMKDIQQEANSQEKQAEHIEKESEKSREILSSEAKAHHSGIEKNFESAKSDKEVAKNADEQLKHDIKVHKLEKTDVEEATENVDEVACAVKDADFIVKEAEKVQKKKKI